MSTLFEVTDRGATLSHDGAYRYDLWRRWAPGPMLGFVMLNPSTADADVDDPTIRRCMGFAKREGLAGITVRNLYAYRSPHPRDLGGVDDPIGAENDEWLRHLAEDHYGVPTIVAAWGACSGVPRRVHVGTRIRDVVRLLPRLRLRRFAPQVWYPAPDAPHPLPLPSDTPLAIYGDGALVTRPA